MNEKQPEQHTVTCLLLQAEIKKNVTCMGFDDTQKTVTLTHGSYYTLH